jgi:phosphohistidine phosphatase
LKLYVMRHGPAEEQANSGLDGDRALTLAGRDRVRAVAKALVELDEQPLQVITSPLVRAVQTAEVVALVGRLGEREGTVEVRRELSPGAPGGGPRPLVTALASSASRRVMLVGHEPDLSDLVTALIPQAIKRWLPSFDKAMVVGLHVGPDGDQTRLRFVLDPRSLKLDPDHRSVT